MTSRQTSTKVNHVIETLVTFIAVNKNPATANRVSAWRKSHLLLVTGPELEMNISDRRGIPVSRAMMMSRLTPRILSIDSLRWFCTICDYFNELSPPRTFKIRLLFIHHDPPGVFFHCLLQERKQCRCREFKSQAYNSSACHAHLLFVLIIFVYVIHAWKHRDQHKQKSTWERKAQTSQIMKEGKLKDESMVISHSISVINFVIDRRLEADYALPWWLHVLQRDVWNEMKWKW